VREHAAAGQREERHAHRRVDAQAQLRRDVPGLEEAIPFELHAGGQPAQAAEIRLRPVGVGQDRHAVHVRALEPVVVSDHAVAAAEDGARELHRHERVAAGVEELQADGRRLTVGTRLQHAAR
jgi:hypothetical protein